MSVKRIESVGLHTGYALEVTEGTAVALTSANFIGSWKVTPIQAKTTTVKIDSVGGAGVDAVLTGKYYGEISSFKAPINEGLDILKTGGAYSTSTSAYYFGGTIYSAFTGSDKGRLSKDSTTFIQYDSSEKVTLAGARCSSLKFGGKDGEVVSLEAGFNGFFSSTSATAFPYPQVNSVSTFKPFVLVFSTLTIAGGTFDFEEVEVDVKPTLQSVETASNASGYSGFEITNVDPTITVTLMPSETKDLTSMSISNAPIAFSWVFAGGGKTYTVAAQVGIESQDISYSNGIQQRKLVLKPVFNAANNYKLSLTVV